MNFRLFGIDVEVQASFWFTTVLLGINFVDLSRGPAGLFPLFVWALVVLVSVLVHELGHALAIRRHRIQPEITLYLMGGLTRWREVLPLGRVDQILISLAGPFAGFFLGGLLFGFKFFAPSMAMRLPQLAQFGLEMLVWVNLVWGVVNLIPVLPLDGGHVLEQALGPKRGRLAAGISMVIAIAVAIWSLRVQWLWTAMIFGMSAFQSMRRLQTLAPGTDAEDVRPRPPVPDVEPPLSGEELSILLRARQAVADEDLGRAKSLVQDLFTREEREGEPLPPRARREGLEVLGWVALVSGHVDEATQRIAEARKLGDVDAALVGATHFAKRELGAARRVLEAARAAGDDRKEIVGPLVQILIEQGEVARASAIAYDIVDSLSEEDARKMAKLAFDGHAFDWSARLYEAVFDRQKSAEDAYEAARAHAQDGAYERALDLLRKAVEAGFSDRGRVWSDNALEALRTRSGLDAVVPRP